MESDILADGDVLWQLDTTATLVDDQVLPNTRVFRRHRVNGPSEPNPQSSPHIQILSFRLQAMQAHSRIGAVCDPSRRGINCRRKAICEFSAVIGTAFAIPVVACTAVGHDATQRLEPETFTWAGTRSRKSLPERRNRCNDRSSGSPGGCLFRPTRFTSGPGERGPASRRAAEGLRSSTGSTTCQPPKSPLGMHIKTLSEWLGLFG